MTSSNQQRSVRCQVAITAYSDDDDFTDFLADAMHYCDSTGQDSHLALAQACRHYIHELNDEQSDERRMK